MQICTNYLEPSRNPFIVGSISQIKTDLPPKLCSNKKYELKFFESVFDRRRDR